MHALSILSILMVFFSSCSSCSGEQLPQTIQVVQAEPVIEEYPIEEPTETEYKGQNVIKTKSPILKDVSIQADTITVSKLVALNQSEKPSTPTKSPVKESPKKVVSRANIITFTPYRPSRVVTSDTFKWYSSEESQKEYKVSLVGVNINTWLETPDYFTVLKSSAKNFPITALLDNLASNNPNFIFNDPNIVSRALKEDIYTPYMQVLPNYKRTLQFADISEVVSYTRHYHVYGVSAGGLPYFGRPVEGGNNREINLGMLRGQIEEVITKLPDTDIYLVAMLNIVPNWLEEGLDINHVPQQQVEILVYAFDKRGKLIGGGGLPSTIRDGGNTYYIEQKVISEFWQTGISRGFYILPSYRILNTKDNTQAKRMPTVEFPTDDRPRLNGNQRYVLSALTHLINSGESVNVELFTSEGKKLIDIEKTKIEKIELDSRKLIHENKYQKLEQKKLEQELSEQQKEQDKIQGLKPILEEEISIESKYISKTESYTLAYYDVSVKLDDFEEKQKQKALKQAYVPSNEGDKIRDILKSVEKILIRPIFTHTNSVYYTNEMLPYESEVDPVEFIAAQKKYAVIPNSVKQFKKEYKKDTKALLQHCKSLLNDRLFWQDYQFGLIKEHIKEVKRLELEKEKLSKKSESLALQELSFKSQVVGISLSNEEIAERKRLEKEVLRQQKEAQKEAERLEKEKLLAEDVEYLYNEWKKIYKQYLKAQLKKLEIERDINMYVELRKELPILHGRNNTLIENKYLGKDEKIVDMKQKVVSRVEKIEEDTLSRIHDITAQEKLRKINEELERAKLEEDKKYRAFVAKIPNLLIKSDSSADAKELSSFSKVNVNIIANGISEGKKSPLMKEKEKFEKKSNREQKRLLKNLSYEGYMLGITKSWLIKTSLEDRLVEL